MLLAKTRCDTLQDVIETTLAKSGYTEVIVRKGPASTPYTFHGHDIVALIWVPKWAMRTYEVASYIQLDCSHWTTRPFVYCVPQAIIRNEAVPLGFVMTPTESAWTYAIFMYRLWQFLTRNVIPRLPVLSDQGPGLGLFLQIFLDPSIFLPSPYYRELGCFRRDWDARHSRAQTAVEGRIH
jgi:hypothetical protein